MTDVQPPGGKLKHATVACPLLLRPSCHCEAWFIFQIILSETRAQSKNNSILKEGKTGTRVP